MSQRVVALMPLESPWRSRHVLGRLPASQQETICASSICVAFCAAFCVCLSASQAFRWYRTCLYRMIGDVIIRQPGAQRHAGGPLGILIDQAARPVSECSRSARLLVFCAANCVGLVYTFVMNGRYNKGIPEAQ